MYYSFLRHAGFKRALLACAVSGCFLLIGAGKGPFRFSQTEPVIKRPREVWVLRTALDNKPRMLSISLNEQLWVAYNTQTGAFYKAWLGKIIFSGPVYSKGGGNQPVADGTTYTMEPDGNPWRIIDNGKEFTPDVAYKGHQFVKEQVKLKYQITYKGFIINVDETPEYVELPGHKAGFSRKYAVSGLPEGIHLCLKTTPGEATPAGDIKTNGKFVAKNNAAGSTSGSLQLISNGETDFTIVFAVKAAETKPAVVKQLNPTEIAVALIAKNDCFTCHNTDTKTIGPSFKAIAAKYNNSAETVSRLAKKIITGGAGEWGNIPMSPHPALAVNDAKTIVNYIFSLSGKKAKASPNKFMPLNDFTPTFKSSADTKIGSGEKPGIAANFYQYKARVYGFPPISDTKRPTESGYLNTLNLYGPDFGNFKENFVVQTAGFIDVPRSGEITFRVLSYFGSRFFIDDKLLIANRGNFALEPKDAKIKLTKGKHSFKLNYFQRGGAPLLSLQWKPGNMDGFDAVPPSAFSFNPSFIKKSVVPVVIPDKVSPGDSLALDAVHPSFDLATVRPDGFKPRVGGMDFLPDGRLVVCTWDSIGAVYVVDGVQNNDRSKLTVKRIATGLAEPLGLKVVNNEIYVLQKHELTKLIDINHDDVCDFYETISNKWDVTANFHEFSFGLLYRDGYFYATLSTDLAPGGASAKNQLKDRGNVMKISIKDGSVSYEARGLRTPNGIGFGVDHEVFITDNQGDWLPANKLIHFEKGAWYGSRAVDFDETARLKETRAVIYLPQDEIANSPSQPAPFNIGPYKNQMIHGDVTNGGIQRDFLEKVNGYYQGAVFRFTQGLEAGVNRLIWGPDGNLYIGGIGQEGNWAQAGKLQYGLQRLTYNGKPTFEMLALRAKPNGLEIEFTEPLKAGSGQNKSDYKLKQWAYKGTSDYGGPKLNEVSLSIKTIKISADRKHVLLEIPGIKAERIIYLRLNRNTISSESGRDLWSTEAWYTMNSIPLTK